jgi:hypothetical protein
MTVNKANYIEALNMFIDKGDSEHMKYTSDNFQQMRSTLKQIVDDMR